MAVSPLVKRLPREFRHNLGKYLGIFLLFLFAIAMGAGYLSAAHSIQVIQDGLHEAAHVEDFHFATEQRAAYAAAEQLLETSEPLDDLGFVGSLRLYLRTMDLDEDAHPVNTTDNGAERIAQAEKFSAASLEVPRAITPTMEPITVYGISEGSRYWREVDVRGGAVVVGSGLAQKCRIKPGDTLALTDKYRNKVYEVVVASTWGSSANMNVYMERGMLNALVGEDVDYFSGYASDEELEIDQRYLATDITPEAMSSSSDQMQESFGSMMDMVVAFAVPVYLILVYLLTKTVIDRSSRYISYMKVFGYHNPEISRLYVRAITVTVLVSLVASLPFVMWLVRVLVVVAMDRYSGNLEIWVASGLLAEVVAIGAVAYVAVALVHIWHIRRVSLAEAMKVQE